MEFKMKYLPALLAAAVTAMPASANLIQKKTLPFQASNNVHQSDWQTDGAAKQIAIEAVQALKQSIATNGLYKLSGSEDFTIKRRWTDELGKTHTHFNQTINGLKVYGTSMITHANKATNSVMKLNAASNFYALTGKPVIVEGAIRFKACGHYEPIAMMLSMLRRTLRH
jgi:Zn-dependent metalloprotease